MNGATHTKSETAFLDYARKQFSLADTTLGLIPWLGQDFELLTSPGKFYTVLASYLCVIVYAAIRSMHPSFGKAWWLISGIIASISGALTLIYYMQTPDAPRFWYCVSYVFGLSLLIGGSLAVMWRGYAQQADIPTTVS